MSDKTTYVIQPYMVGTRKRKSLAMIIPAKFARDNHIDNSTIFVVKNEKQGGKIVLHRIKGIGLEGLMPTGESFQASNQQASDVEAQ